VTIAVFSEVSIWLDSTDLLAVGTVVKLVSIPAVVLKNAVVVFFFYACAC